MELRDYQREALDVLRASVRQGCLRICLGSPTGSGKTAIAGAIAAGAIAKSNRMAFVVPAISLIDQTVAAFAKQGIKEVGVIQQDHGMTNPERPVQICSIQTLQARKMFADAAVVVFDECHVLHKQHLAWLADEKFKKVPFIGLSATPWTRGLGRYFQSLHVVATTQQMIDAGHLSKFRTFAVSAPDLEGVRIVAGDYHEGELSARCQQDGKLTADIVKTWQERWGKGGTLVFAVDCAHAKQLQERFKAVGATVAYQDAATPIRERNIIREQFQSGEVQVIVNIMTMTIGVDLDVRCISFCRPTHSEMMFVQCIGRGLRTAEGKESLLLLDHSGTTERLGFVTDIDVRHDHLDDGKPKREKSVREAPLPKACEQCGYMSPRRERVCSNCGHTHPEKVSAIVERDGQLVEVTGQRAVRRRASPHHEAGASERLAWYRQLCWIGRDRGYKPGWAAVQYRERFGSWPPREWGMAEPEEPQPKVLSWVKSRMIAWARGRRSRERERGDADQAY